MHPTLETSRPVIIVDGNGRGDIGVIRSLGLVGIDVHLLTDRPGGVSAASRHVTGVHQFPSWEASPEEQLGAIEETAAKLSCRPIIMSTGDRSLSLLSAHRDRIEGFADQDLAPHELILNCLDKVRFAEIARELEFPTPETITPSSLAELEHVVSNIDFPVFVKPVERSDWHRLPAGTVYSAKGTKVMRPSELLELFSTLEAHDACRVVVQSFVDGPARMHISVHAYRDPLGRIVGAFSARKPRVFPAHAGVACMVTSSRIPAVLDIAKGVLNALDYRGFAIIQFKQVGPAEFQLLEINCRYSTWTEMPTRAGANFPAISYACQTGQPIEMGPIREGISWWDAVRDLSTIPAYRRSSEESIRSFLWSLRSVRAFAFFAFDDPGPFFRKLVTAPRR